MATLSRELRNALERVVLTGRREAEAGARKALDHLAVAHREPWPTMTPDQQAQRRRLRARGRQLGDRLDDGGLQSVDHLVSECAYEQWHRMLFARFLAECELLIEPVSGVSVSVIECKELARERGVDWISLASAFAQGMLPQIFRADDAVLEVGLPAEHRQSLEQLLASLSSDVFLADDSLGWVYQFWQSEEKARVNESEKKIGADELPAVTQLFTEDYMVEFLLHNTLGAWWAARRFPQGVVAASEGEARSAVAVAGVEWKYLRFIQGQDGRWSPAAGAFEGWPDSARDFRLLDPCMGSGHFLVSALAMLVAIRRAEQAMSLPDACAAVVRDNLFGLEIDPRCTQIAAFNLGLAAWKEGGWQQLPALNLACSGLKPNARAEEWTSLAGTDEQTQRGMEELYGLFSQASVLGSLVNPRALGGDLLVRGFKDLQPMLAKALAPETLDDGLHELAVTAQGVVKAAELLAGQFTLVITNVPYLSRSRQDEPLRAFADLRHANAKHDLATCFVERCLDFTIADGTVALVTPVNWLILGRYERLRKDLLHTKKWNAVVRLGPGAFETISGEVVNVALLVITNGLPADASHFCGLDVSEATAVGTKARDLEIRTTLRLSQSAQMGNPDARLLLHEQSTGLLLKRIADSRYGLRTGDLERFALRIWELPHLDDRWKSFLGTVESTRLYGGRERVLLWEGGAGALRELADLGIASIQGQDAWGRYGVAVSLMGPLPCTIYAGEMFDNGTGVIWCTDPKDLPAVFAFCSANDFSTEVRKLDHSIKVTNQTLLKVPFDLSHWRECAAKTLPRGLPQPESNDPTQWLFNGNPAQSERPLLVAVARLLGYGWPRQTGSGFCDAPALQSDHLERYADGDGIVCVTPLKGDESASERLRLILAAAFGEGWSVAKLDELLGDVGYSGRTLEDWLRDGFFEQHSAVFHHRPFVWHIWDGRRDGFSALVNYHKLTRANLEKLTYAYLGDWIRRQEAAAGTREAGAEARLVAAMKLQDELKKILEGDPPYDIFVRWKTLVCQSIGWEPDLRDGVRMNIRPFLMATDVGKKGAGILRARPNIKWDKDRGKEPPRSKDEFPWFWGWDDESGDFAGGPTFDGNRWNDLHYSREFKMAARRKKGLA